MPLKKIFYTLFFLIGIFQTSQTVLAADRYWVGNDAGCVGNVWSDSDCWSDSSGGAGGFSVPTTGDNALFDSNDTSSATIDIDVDVDSIQMLLNYTGSVDASGSNLDIRANLIVQSNGGTFTAPDNTKTFTLGEDITLSDGSQFDANGGEVTIDGTTASILSTTTGRILFEDLTINKGNATTNVTFGNVRILDVWDLNQGRIGSSGSSTIETYGDVVWGTVTDFNANFPNITFASDIDVSLEKLDRLGNLVISNINKADLTVDTDVIAGGISMNSLTISGGTLDNDANNNLTFFNSISVTLTGGEFRTGTGTVSGNSIFVQGGTYTNQSSSLTVSSSSGEIDITSGTFNGGTGTIDIQSQNVNTSLDLNGGTFNSTSGTLIVEGGIDIEPAATFNHNNGLLEFQMALTRTWDDDAGSTYNNIIINHDVGTAETNLFSDLDIDGNFTITNGEFDANTATINIGGNVRIADDPDTQFIAATSTVILDGTDQNVLGPFHNSHDKASAFNNFTKQVAAEATLTLDANEIIQFTGALILEGAVDQLLNLVTDVDGDQVQFDPEGALTLDYISVKDNNNIRGSDIDVSTLHASNEGNNTNWTFATPPNNPASLSPASFFDGSSTNNTTPAFTFSTSDPAPAKLLRYMIEIDDDSDFSSRTIAYRSSFEAQGSKTFTVGQAAGAGTYLVGNVGQTLPEGEYYIRISTTNENLSTTEFTTNSGNPAIAIDTTAPTIALQGDATISLEEGSVYTDPGATASDSYEGDISGSIISASTVNAAVPGSYSVTYDVQDNAGNTATQVVRTVNITARQGGGGQNTLISIAAKKAAESEKILGTTKIREKEIPDFICSLENLNTLQSKINFTDAENHWAQDRIEKWSHYNIFGQYPDNLFKPDASITRAEFANLIFEMKNEKGDGKTNVNEIFSDITEEDRFSKAIKGSWETGFTEGYTDGTFKPNQNITRAEGLKMLLEGCTTGFNIQSPEGPFIDVSTNDWFQAYVNFSVKQNIVEGFSIANTNYFIPNGTMTRAEALKIIDLTLALHQ